MPDLSQSVYHLLRQQFPADWIPLQCSKATLIDFSHAIEDTFIVHKLPGVLFTGFQESRYWKREVARYRYVSEIAHAVCVFAGRDLPPDASYQETRITLPENSPLRQEWFVIALTPRFSILLAGLDKQMPTSHEARRLFDTLWTFDPQVIHACLDALMPLIRERRPDKADQVTSAVQRFPPIAPDAHFASLLTQKFLGHLQQQHQFALQNVDQLDRLVERRTQELAVEKETMARIIQRLSSAVIVSDAQGKIFMANDVGELLLSGSWDTNNQYLPHLLNLLQEASTQGEIFQREINLGDLTLLFSTAKVSIGDEAPLTVTVLHDLSHMYRLDRMQHRFFDVTSHELRSPLTVINMQLYLMQRDKAHFDTYLTTLEEAIRRLESIVNNMLDMTELSLFSTNYPALYVEQFAEQLRTHITMQLWKDRVEFTSSVPPRTVIQADAKRLVLCLLDLLDIASERDPEGGVLGIEFELEVDAANMVQLCMRVSDRGPHIPPEVLRDAFQPYAGTSIGTPTGSLNLSLRLALTRRIVEAHGGSLHLRSDDRGTTITLRIPSNVTL